MSCGVQSCCGWNDLLKGDRVPMGKVVLMRDARGSEWLAFNTAKGPEGQTPVAWSAIR